MTPKTERDPLAEELLVVISDAVMHGIANEAPSFTVHDAEQHRSFLRALGATMALFAMSAETAGALAREEARAVVLSGFASKFSLTVRPTPEKPS